MQRVKIALWRSGGNVRSILHVCLPFQVVHTPGPLERSRGLCHLRVCTRLQGAVLNSVWPICGLPRVARVVA